MAKVIINFNNYKKAGPETKAKLLSGLGLKGYLVTDGKNPINLFNTANGFMGGAHP
jgi:major vault protein